MRKASAFTPKPPENLSPYAHLQSPPTCAIERARIAMSTAPTEAKTKLRLKSQVRGRAHLLPPSTIEFTEQLDALMPQLRERAVMFIQGAPLIGKSTLLKQMALRLAKDQKRFYYHEVSQRTGRDSLLRQLAEEVILERPLKDDEEAVDVIFHRLESENSYLLIDNLHHVDDGADILEFLTNHLLQGRVILTGASLPQVSERLALDFYFYNFKGFTAEQSEKFIESSKVKLDAADPDIRTYLVAECRGRPFVLKSLIARSLSSGKPIERAHLSFDVEDYRREIFSRLWTPLSGASRMLVREAALATDLPELQRELLQAALNPFQRQDLENIGESAFFEAVLRTGEKDENRIAAASLVEKLKDSDGVGAGASVDPRNSVLILRLCSQFGDLINDEQLVGHAAIASDHLTKKGDLRTIIEITNGCVLKISLKTLLQRRQALIQIQSPERSVEDLELRISVTPTNHPDYLNILSTLGVSYGSIGKYEKAKELLQKACDLSASGSPEHIRALLHFAVTSADREPKIANEALVKAESALLAVSVEQNANENSYWILWFEFWRTKGFYLSNLGDYEGDLATQHQAKRALEHASIYKGALEADMLATQIEMGLFNSELSGHFENHISGLSSQFDRKGLTSAHLQRAEYFLFQGTPKAALESIRLIEDQILPGVSRPFRLWQNRILYSLYLFNGAHSSAVSALKAHPSLLAQSQRFDSLFSHLQGILDLRVSWNQNRADKLLENVMSQIDTQSLPLDDAITALRYLLDIGLFEYGWKPNLDILEKLYSLTQRDPHRVNYFHKTVFSICFALSLLRADRRKESSEILERCHIQARQAGMHRWQLASLLGLKIQAASPFTRSPDLEVEVKNLLAAIEPCSERTFLESNDNNFSAFNLYAEITRSTEIRIVGFKKNEPSAERSSDINCDPSTYNIRFRGASFCFSHRPVLFKLVQVLSENLNQKMDKESLVEKVWQENYNPLVHDTRIYTAMKRLREEFKRNGIQDGITTFDGTYELNLRSK